MTQAPWLASLGLGRDSRLAWAARKQMEAHTYGPTSCQAMALLRSGSPVHPCRHVVIILVRIAYGRREHSGSDVLWQASRNSGRGRHKSFSRWTDDARSWQVLIAASGGCQWLCPGHFVTRPCCNCGGESGRFRNPEASTPWALHLAYFSPCY